MELIWNRILNPFKEDKLNASKREPIYTNDDSSEQYALITSPRTSPRDVLEFNHDKSTALCIGINKRYHRKYAGKNNKSFEKTIARDAEAMGEAFVSILGLNREHVEIRISSTQRDDCTKKGVNALFVESAKMVEERGIFIFYFAGHGVMIGDRCVLAPADFAGSEDLNSGISGNDLVEWLDVAECKADHVLIILDCCYAGNLGTTLTSPGNMLKIKLSLFVMCGCAAREKCMSVDALEHTIFTYFFLHCLKTHQCKIQHQCMGQFAVKQAMEDITELCFNFSSLYLSYADHNKGELQPRTMNPTLDRLDYREIEVGIDEPDSPSRLESVIQLFELGRPKPAPHSEVVKWLKSPMIQNALFTLYSKDTFSETLHKAILSALLYSAASIQYIHDKTHLEERNLFLMMVINVLGAIGFAYPEVDINMFHLITGLKHYMQPMLFEGINIMFLHALLSEMAKKATEPDNVITALTVSNDTEDGDDEVDGSATSQSNMLNKVAKRTYDRLLATVYTLLSYIMFI